MREGQDVVRGEIRIALSSDLGRNLVTPWLDEFLLSNPNVALRSNISDSNIDFYRDSVDMALRYGSPHDASMYGFKICDVPRLLCATPDYLAKYGTPEQPDDLLSHNALLYQLHDSLQDSWKFFQGKKEFKVKLSGNRASNDGDLVRRWCSSGKGVAIKSCLDMSEELLSGKVVNVMPDYRPTPTELWLICPSKQSITPSVRLLRDLFRQKAEEILTRLSEKGILD
jgi:DNA-binding transcriptional LysR family regulator